VVCARVVAPALTTGRRSGDPGGGGTPTGYQRLPGACSHRGVHRSLQVTTPAQPGRRRPPAVRPPPCRRPAPHDAPARRTVRSADEPASRFAARAGFRPHWRTVASAARSTTLLVPTTCATSIGTCVTRDSRPPPIRGLQGGIARVSGRERPTFPSLMRRRWKLLPAIGRQAPQPGDNRSGHRRQPGHRRPVGHGSSRDTGVQPGHRRPVGHGSSRDTGVQPGHRSPTGTPAIHRHERRIVRCA
jgi:hypothetical protein